jgi:hypothetical protein
MPASGSRGLGLGSVAAVLLHLMQWEFQNRGSMARQGPAAQPAAVAVIIDTDHLVELLIAAEMDAVALKEAHDRGPEEKAGERTVLGPPYP